MKKKIALIGLGYVGLPLAVEFGKKFEVIGFDISKERIDLLKKYDTFGLNAAHREYERMGFTPTYYGSFDYAVCDFHKDTYKNMILDSENKIKKYYFVNYHFRKKEEIFKDSKIINHSKFQKLNFKYRHLEKKSNPLFDENKYKPHKFDNFIKIFPLKIFFNI